LNQLAIDFDAPLGRKLRDRGMARSTGNADDRYPGWAERAHGYLLEFLAWHDGNFMAEELRQFAYEKGFERPPSERAWGSVLHKAAKQNLIRMVGYAKVSNPNAHNTPAAVWTRA